MSKILNDKYYTLPIVAKKCIDTTFQLIGIQNITHIIEPSAGNGSFSDQLTCMAYDIEPESDNIIKQDFLQLNIPYQKGRLIIGNPPYGPKMHLVVKFFKKAIELGDFISFILPISQLDNIVSLYEFDLIHSEDLGLQEYSDRKLHCCLNIYSRNKNGQLNKKPNFKMKDLSIVRESNKGYDEIQNFDLRMVYWGSGCAGRILSHQDRKFAGEYKIIIHNEKLKERIISVLSTADWRKELKVIAMMRIKHYHIYNLLKREIPEIN